MFRVLTAFVLFTFVTGCASTTMLHSYPPGATVKSASGMVLGVTPYEHTDSAAVGHVERFLIEKDGYETQYVSIKKDQWNGVKTTASVVGGVFLFIPFVGLLWSADYRPDYAVQLKPIPERVSEFEEVEQTPRARRTERSQRPVTNANTNVWVPSN